MKAKLALLFIFLLLVFAAGAQQVTDPQQVVADIVEELTANSDAEQDYSELVDELLQLAENPLNLNAARKSDLQKLFFLSHFQIESLLNYRDSTGKIISVYELQLVPGFDLIDVEQLIPFVVAGEVVEPVKVSDFTQGKHDFSSRIKTLLQTPVGFDSEYAGSGKYLGSKYALCTRYRYKANRLQIGLTAEKDAGEPLFDGTFPTGFDYLSGYAQVNDIGRIKRLVVGDFRAEFGQGLTFWNSLTFGKSANVMGLHMRGRGIVPHSSANESLFLRGAGITLNFRNIDFSIFSSYQKIDANLVDTVSSGELAFTSLPETGYHRTVSEIRNRRNVPELVTGGNITLTLNKLKLGITAVYNRIYGENLKSQPIYTLVPTATEKLVWGLNADYYYRQHLIYGEVGVNMLSQKSAVLAGGKFRLSNRVQLSALCRNYSTTYETRYTAALAEGTGTVNEQGLLMGLNLLAAKGWKVSGYVDLFRFPWMRYGVYSPSTGRDFLFQSEHSVNRYFQVNFRYRYKQDERNMTASSLSVTPVISQMRQGFRTQLSYQPNELVQLKSTIEVSSYKTDSLSTNEYGYLLAQDININLKEYPLTFRMRFAIFDTKSWNTRIYSYESDMLYSFTVPAYYSNGTRVMLMAKYRYKKNIDIWARYAQTYYPNSATTGSGADLIEGNTRSEVKFMVRVKF
ncbi:MAG TPA: helix-hairpin-helix domain-containing protein [Bacteroidales bacterium]|nr:helix-hairpin-helix domain-containing protein [Bacteroidales bacterium]